MEAMNAISNIHPCGCRTTYFGQLMPIEVVPTIKLKDKWVIDLRLCPDFTIQTKEKEEEQTEKVPGVNLYVLGFTFVQEER